MNPFIVGGLVSGGLNLIGDMVSQSNARSAFKSRYQDTVADMRKAGLNPALAYGQGGGNPQTSDYGDIGSSAVQAAHSAASARLTNAQADLLKAQTNDLLITTAAKRGEAVYRAAHEGTRSEQANLRFQRESQLYPESLAKYRAQLAKDQADAERARLGLPEARAYSKYYDSSYGRNEPYMQSARDWSDAASKWIPKGSRGPQDYRDETTAGRSANGQTWKVQQRKYKGNR